MINVMKQRRETKGVCLLNRQVEREISLKVKRNLHNLVSSNLHSTSWLDSQFTFTLNSRHHCSVV